MTTEPRWSLRTTPDDLRQRYFAEGLWTDETFAQFIDRRVAADPSLRVRIWSDTHPHTTTAGELNQTAARIAGGLVQRGIGPGDVIAYQMPNWIETLAVLWAGFRTGATMVPIIHFYGPREVSFILRQSGAKALVTCSSFGPVDHLANLTSIRSDLDALETIVVSDAPDVVRQVAGAITLDELASADPLADAVVVDPDAPAMVGYTSGTTADPKGVVHTHRSLLAEVRQLASMNNFGNRPNLMASPLAHMTGMLGGSLVPLHLGNAIELIDKWDPGRVLEIIDEADINPGGGATIFLTSLLDHPTFGPRHLECTPKFGLGGAPVPAAVADRAEALGIRITRAYGSTEHPSITGSTPESPVRARTRTDGSPMAGIDIRLLDDDGQEVGVGAPGEILSRGPDLFLGYTDPALTAKVFEGSWYRTGDVGVLDEHGCVTITDRVSDVIIRGGLNLSAAEIEERIATFPSVAEVAVVAAPDERLGEKACAVIRTVPGADAPDLASLQAHLEAAGLPRQKWPEQLQVVVDFPRTPSGKIKKRDLRDDLRQQR